MKPYLTLILCTVACIFPLSAQTVQKVQIVEYQGNQKKTALPGVNLAVAGASAALSDHNGLISLNFVTLKSGDKVVVHRLQKNGYQIFNQEAVDQWTISTTRPFRIVMCRTSQYDKLCKQYWKVSAKSYRKQFEKDSKQLNLNYKKKKIQKSDYMDRLAQLRDQYEAQFSNLDNYVKQFARIDLAELTKQEQQIIDLVRNGQINEAIALYENLDFIKQYNQQSADILKIDMAQAELTEAQLEMIRQRGQVQGALLRLISTYQIAGGRENFAKAGNMFRQAAMADTTNLSLLYEYADFCGEQTDYEEQKRVLSIYLRNLKDDPYQQVRALSDRASAERDLRDAESAVVDLRQGLAIADSMSAMGMTEQYEFFTIEMYNKLIDLFGSMGNEETLNLVQKFETRLDSLYRDQPDKYALEKSYFLDSKSVYLMLKGDFQSAAPYLKQSIEILDPYMDKNNDLGTNDLITNTYYYLSVALNRLGEQDAALKYNLRNVERLERLYAKNPASYALCLVVNYSGVATVYKDLHQQKKAESYLTRSFEAIEALKDVSVAYSEFKFMLCVDGYQIYQDLSKCLKFAHEAVDMFPTLPSCAQQTYAPKYAEALKFLKDYDKK